MASELLSDVERLWYTMRYEYLIRRRQVLRFITYPPVIGDGKIERIRQ